MDAENESVVNFWDFISLFHVNYCYDLLVICIVCICIFDIRMFECDMPNKTYLMALFIETIKREFITICMYILCLHF